MEWPRGAYFSDFETQIREQVLHFDFPVSLDQVIIMSTLVKSRNAESRIEIICKYGDLGERNRESLRGGERKECVMIDA